MSIDLPRRESALSVSAILRLATIASFVVALAFAPFWYGGNRQWSWDVNTYLFGIGLGFAFASALWRVRDIYVLASRIWFPALVFCGVLVWIFIQSLHSTPEAWHAAMWSMLKEQGASVEGAISVDPDTTLSSLLWLFPPVASFLIAAIVGIDALSARAVILSLSIIGLLYALYGLIGHAVAPDMMLWMERMDPMDGVSSTFVNRNSYATYAGLGMICAFSLSLDALMHELSGSGGLKRLFLAFVSGIGDHAGLVAIIGFIIGAACIMTGSRGGVLSSIAGFSALLFLFFAARRGKAGAKSFAMIGTTALIVAVLLVFGDFFFARLGLLGLEEQTRANVYWLTWLSVLDNPLFGFGYGTFQFVFPWYQDDTIPKDLFWDRAHNNYLELAQGVGLPAAILFFASLGALWLLTIRGSLLRYHGAMVPRLAAAATLLVALHSAVDFSLQMQGVAVTWAAILGLGVSQSISSREFDNA